MYIIFFNLCFSIRKTIKIKMKNTKIRICKQIIKNKLDNIIIAYFLS
jgi:hypothetical protein